MQPFKLVQKVLGKKPMNQTKLAEALGVSQSTISRWSNGDVEDMKVGHLAALEEIAIRHGIVDPEDRGKYALLLDGVKELDARAGAGGGGTGALPHIEGGFLVFPEDITRPDKWLIPDTFLREPLRLTPERALIIEVIGDSGYDPANPHVPGSVFSGNRIVVDTADRDPSHPGQFAVYDGSGIVVKTASVIHDSEPMKIRLSSRNPIYQPYDVLAEEGRIIGRVKGIFAAAP